MITKEIAQKIWHCYIEIEQAEKMIATMKENINTDGDLDLKDGWGERHNCLQLHIPNGHGHGSFSVRSVSMEVALVVLQQHIEKNKKELERLSVTCKVQLA
jgi:hypothetical protein